MGLSFRRHLHGLNAFLLSHRKSLDQLFIILKLEKSPNNHSFKIARTLSIDTSLFEMECILKNMKNKSHLSEIIYESYLHTIFLTTLIFLLTIGYARKHLVHHCSNNSKAGICISWTVTERKYFMMSQKQHPLDLSFSPQFLNFLGTKWSPQLEFSGCILPLSHSSLFFLYF